MNTHRLHALTSAHVDTLKRALRIAIRHDKQTLHHDAKHMQPGVLAQARAAIRAMEQLADGLSPSAPPELPRECEHCGYVYAHRCIEPVGIVPPFELPENDAARYDPTRYSKD